MPLEGMSQARAKSCHADKSRVIGPSWGVPPRVMEQTMNSIPRVNVHFEGGAIAFALFLANSRGTSNVPLWRS